MALTVHSVGCGTTDCHSSQEIVIHRDDIIKEGFLVKQCCSQPGWMLCSHQGHIIKFQNLFHLSSDQLNQKPW